MVSALYHVAVFHNEYEVGVLYCGKPVRYNKARASFGERIHSFLNEHLGAGVYAARV